MHICDIAEFSIYYKIGTGGGGKGHPKAWKHMAKSLLENGNMSTSMSVHSLKLEYLPEQELGQFLVELHVWS